MSSHYHQYEVVRSTADGLTEVCKTCKNRLITKVGRDGRIDNRKYLKEHAADFAQPTGSTSKIFNQLYAAPKKA